MTFFESPLEPGSPSGWRPKLPDRARRELDAKHLVSCKNCGGRTELGTNEDEEVVCEPCWSKGGHGFAWWRS